MNLILSGRGVGLDDSLRRYATEKLTRVQRFFDRIIKMEVELTEERNRHGIEHRVEVTLRAPGETLRAHGEGPDHFAAIDKVAERLEKQLKRVKDRLRHRPYRVSKAEMNSENPPAPEPALLRRTVSIDKPLTPEEARLELEDRGFVFLMFTNAETMRPAVIYRRNGGFGLIEPES